MNRSPENLLIISHVVHYQWRDRLYAYEPYAREIDIWADLFPQIKIASPLRRERPPGDCAAFSRTNIAVSAQVETGGFGFRAKVHQLFRLPKLCFSLIGLIRRADAVHVRCPGNLGLLGALLAPLFNRRLIAKYAGQWLGFPGESLTVRLQRRLLRSRWWRGPVTVYGDWPGQPHHVVPFFTSVMDAAQVERARIAARGRRPGKVLELLYVGRLSKAKNVDVLIEAVAALQAEGLALGCRIVGDGPQRSALEGRVRELDLRAQIRFTGALAFERVLELYPGSDVLVLASETEGWPKAIAEGMAFGLICIGSRRGLVPWLLEERGLLVEPRDLEGLKAAVRRIAEDREGHHAMSLRAAEFAQAYSLEGLRDALTRLLNREWQTELRVEVPTEVSPT